MDINTETNNDKKTSNSLNGTTKDQQSMSIEESVRLVAKGDVALIEWDLIGESANKMSSATMTRFKEVLEQVEENKDFKAAVIISRKKSIFMAGADINEIKSLKTKEDFSKAVEGGQEVVNFLEDMRVPVIVAIHGACMGGGCEMAIACDYRIATEDKATRIGLPEVLLGIIPGFGGCVRLPRLIGIEAAYDIILNGKAVDGKKAKRIGLVDKVVPVKELENEAMRMAHKIIKKKSGKRYKEFTGRGLQKKVINSNLMKGFVSNMAKKNVMKFTGGHYPAPLKAIEVIKKTYGLPRSQRDRALRIEREAFCEVAVTQVSKNLINVFFLREDVKKRNGVADASVKGHDVHTVGVLGAGTMGGGIAYAAADKGMFVRMKDIGQEAIDIGYQAAEKIWKKKLKRRRLSKYEFSEKKSRITGVLDYTGFDKLDVVIEAIVENMDIKKKVIGETASKVPADCIIATNTSSLSVNEMAKGHPNPANFVGMHFFNPVDKMPLVEVIRGEQSSDEATATIFNLAKKMGKVPVVVKDGPGFLVNRLLIPYLIEAAHFLQEGMDIQKVDDLYKKQFGMPMGPFHLLDEIGLDVGVKVSKIFRESLGERIEIPDTMVKLEKSDRMGKKNKKGFYLWDENGKKGGVDTSIYSEFGLGTPTNPLTDEEIIGRGIYNMINEAATVLIEEKIVESPGELDLAMIMGTGFPPFRGGLLRYADTIGTQKICDDLEVFATKYGERLRPMQTLRTMAKTNRSFY